MRVEYRHGGDIYGENKIMLDFSVNTNPLGMPEAVGRAVAEHPEDFSRYPDSRCRELKRELADYFTEHYAGETEFSPEDFICGNGAADILYSLMFAMRPAKGLIPVPAFGEYEQALKAAGGEAVKLYGWEKMGDGAAGLLENIDIENIDMVILGNPNNPTGSVLSEGQMKMWLDICEEKNIMLVVDECFNWFLDEPRAHSLAPLLDRRRNVFILNAFTKIYAMAGLRLGFGICKDRDVMERIENCRQPWSVSGAAMRGGIAALSEEEYLSRTRETVVRERKFLSEGLEKLGFTVYPSKVNFLLFLRNDVVDYDAFCRSRGILIRSCKNFDGLGDAFYRVAVKTRAENEALLRCLYEGREKGGKGDHDTGNHVECGKEPFGGGTVPHL